MTCLLQYVVIAAPTLLIAGSNTSTLQCGDVLGRLKQKFLFSLELLLGDLQEIFLKRFFSAPKACEVSLSPFKDAYIAVKSTKSGIWKLGEFLACLDNISTMCTFND
jgi:hypothetical protein